MPRTLSAPRISFLQRLHDWVFSSEQPAWRAAAWLRTLLRVLFIMQREFFRTNIHIRSAALTYSLALAMVPTLALSTAIMKGVGSDAHLKSALSRLIDQLEPLPAANTDARIRKPETLPGPGPDDSAGDVASTQTEHPSGIGPGNGAAAEEQKALPGMGSEEVAGQEPVPLRARQNTGYLHRGLDLVFEYVEKTNFAALGLVGVLGLLAIFVMMLSAFEDAMNSIWHCQQRRSFLRRIMDYLALVTVLPLSLNIAVAVDAILASDQLMAYLQHLMPSSWVLAVIVKLSTFCFIVLSLMGMYIFFPSDKVKSGAALVGAIFATFFWFLFQRLYIVLQVGVSKYNAIYGSFATIPLILICLNLGIVFILLGASLTHAIQYRNHYSPTSRELSPQRQLQLAFDILAIVHHNFSRRIPTTLQLLQDSLPDARPQDIEEILALLVSGQIVQQNSDETGLVLPLISAEQLSGSEVLALIVGTESLATPGGLLAEKALQAAAQTLQGNLIEAVNETVAGEKTSGDTRPFPAAGGAASSVQPG